MKNKKLLFVDPLSQEGHLNFNKIYIKALFQIFDSIDFAFIKGYEEKLSISNDNKVYLIPEKYHAGSRNKILNRLRYIQIFRFIKKHCNINNYDFVIFSSYEEISLYFSFINRTLILVNHNNLSGLQNRIKLFFFKKISSKNISIVFEDYMRDYLLSLGLKNVYSIKHGLPCAFDIKLLENAKLIDFFSWIKDFRYIIFSPSGSSTDDDFLNDLILNDAFNMFLRKNGILLILKNKLLKSDSQNIKIIRGYLTDIQYKYVFLRSDLILIPYSINFSYRVSAVLFESMANKKNCLFTGINALNIYRIFFTYDPSFNSADELKDKISYLMANNDNLERYTNLSKLEPNFNQLFKI